MEETFPPKWYNNFKCVICGKDAFSYHCADRKNKRFYCPSCYNKLLGKKNWETQKEMERMASLY